MGLITSIKTILYNLDRDKKVLKYFNEPWRFVLTMAIVFNYVWF